MLELLWGWSWRLGTPQGLECLLVPHNTWGASPVLAPQSLPNFISEPHPKSSRLCQGDWKFLLSSGWVISTPLSGGRGGSTGLGSRSAFCSGRDSAGPPHPSEITNNRLQHRGLSAQCVPALCWVKTSMASTFQHPGQAGTVTHPSHRCEVKAATQATQPGAGRAGRGRWWAPKGN